MKNCICKFDKKLLAVYGLVFVGFAALVYLVPYSHDDWAWGSEVGLQRLESGFVDYNGRYFGNFLILALTRSKLLQVLITAFSALLLCCLPGMYFGKNTTLLTVFSAMLVLFMPKAIFTQTVVWSSGYSNYMPPILTTVLYYVLIKNIFGEEKPKYSKITPIVCCILGVSGSLFMEHMTLYSLAISVLIVLFVLIKFKKLYLTHLAFLAGCVAGTLIMFTNSAYGLIAGANDAQGGYRSTALSDGLVETLIDNLKFICYELFVKNTAILFIMSLLVVVLAIGFMKSSEGKKRNALILTCLFVNLLCLILIFVKSRYTDWSVFLPSSRSALMTLLLMAASAAFYCLSVLGIVLLCVSDKGMMQKMLLILISVPVVTAPLLVVSPLSSRCFLPQYFLMMIFCVVLLGYMQKKFEFTAISTKMALCLISAVTLALCIFTFNIYSTIHIYAEKRDEYIQKQIANGETTVMLCRLPNSEYIYLGTPTQKMWTDRFKMFHGIDESIEFEILSYDEFDKWAEEYDAKEK